MDYLSLTFVVQVVVCSLEKIDFLRNLIIF